MRSLTFRAHTTRICDTPCGIAGISRTLSGMADRFNRCHLPLHVESPPNQVNLNSREVVVVARLSRASIRKLTSSLEDTGCKKTEGNRNSLTGRFWWPQTALRPIPMVETHDILQSGRPVAQLRSPRAPSRNVIT
jgi:hypothetical protein